MLYSLIVPSGFYSFFENMCLTLFQKEFKGLNLSLSLFSNILADFDEIFSKVNFNVYAHFSFVI